MTQKSKNTNKYSIYPYKRKSQMASVWIRFKKNKLAMIGLVVILILTIVAATADLWLDYERQCIEQNMGIRFQRPNRQHWFGTDHYGRDLFARIVYGTRVSLFIGLFTIVLSLLIGGIIGALAGYFGKRIDSILMRLMDILLSIPAVLLALTIVAALGNGVINLIIALTVSTVPKFAYIIRSSVITIKGDEFIEAARAYGSSNIQIIVRHIIPNILGPVIVQATTNMAHTILLISSLSYVGLGLPSSVPEWGSIISASKQYMRHNPYLVYIPGIAIVISVMAMNLIGDGLRDALDPKLKN